MRLLRYRSYYKRKFIIYLELIFMLKVKLVIINCLRLI